MFLIIIYTKKKNWYLSRASVCVYKEGMCQEYGTKENVGRNERKRKERPETTVHAVPSHHQNSTPAMCYHRCKYQQQQTSRVPLIQPSHLPHLDACH